MACCSCSLGPPLPLRDMPSCFKITKAGSCLESEPRLISIVPLHLPVTSAAHSDSVHTARIDSNRFIIMEAFTQPDRWMFHLSVTTAGNSPLRLPLHPPAGRLSCPD